MRLIDRGEPPPWIFWAQSSERARIAAFNVVPRSSGLRHDEADARRLDAGEPIRRDHDRSRAAAPISRADRTRLEDCDHLRREYAGTPGYPKEEQAEEIRTPKVGEEQRAILRRRSFTGRPRPSGSRSRRATRGWPARPWLRRSRRQRGGIRSPPAPVRRPSCDRTPRHAELHLVRSPGSPPRRLDAELGDRGRKPLCSIFSSILASGSIPTLCIFTTVSRSL